MDQLAASGGVTKPILYRHFGDRDGLARAIGDHFASILMATLAEAMRDAGPDEILRGTIDAYLAFLEREPNLYSFLSSPSSRLVDQAAVIHDAIARQVAVTIGDQLRALGLDAGGAEPYAFGVVGMVHQAGDWWLRAGTMSRQALTTYLTRLLWTGFEGLATATPGGAEALSAPTPASGAPLH